MARQPEEVMARLRLDDLVGENDWSRSAEGHLLLYDPSVVTDAVFAELTGTQAITPAALGWMAGHQTSRPLVAEPHHWPASNRSETAKTVARVVELGWERSLCVIPFFVHWNGTDVRFRSGPLRSDEKKANKTHLSKHKTGAWAKPPEPLLGWVTARKNKLGVTWSWMLGFTPEKKRELFGPGYQVEFDWPAGEYAVRGWSFGEEEDDDGLLVDRLVVQLESS